MIIRHQTNISGSSQAASIPTTSRKRRSSAAGYFKGFNSTAVATYAGVFLLIVAMVAIGYQPPKKDTVANVASPSTTAKTAAQPSVDQMVATGIASDIATQANLPIAANIANLSQSLTAEDQLAQKDSSVISKPQIVQPSANSTAMRSYVAAAGDTVEAVATKYNISATTVRWANNLTSDALTPGQKLVLPPVNGIVYTVKSGDTVESLASKYKSSNELIVSYNNLELSTSLTPGGQVIIPNGELPASEQPGYTPPRSTPSTANTGSAGGSGYGAVDASMAMASAGNRYAYGNCTWYAYNRRAELGRPIGSFWGNASTWAAYARAAGYTVNGTPAPGAIMASGGGYAGYGHVAIVESVNPDGSVNISEMNGYRWGGGFARIARGTIPASEAMSGMYSYIH